MSKLIEVKELKKSYKKGEKIISVLSGINLEVEEGEFLSITGSSGVGKSTLLHILGFLDIPDDGLINFNGKDITKFSEVERAGIRNKEIGFVFQFHYLIPEFNALENVMMPGMIEGKNREEVAEIAHDLLTQVGLEERMDHKPSELSGGEQQRVAIARALTNSPSILLMDEPTGNLDTVTGENVFGIIKLLQENKKQTIILVTHNEDLANEAHRSLKLAEGILK